MIQKVFSVYDKGVEAFMAPFFTRSRGEALRSFLEACADPKIAFHKHPHDYSLFYLGEYDDAKGAFSQPVAPERVLTAQEAVTQGSALSDGGGAA